MAEIKKLNLRLKSGLLSDLQSDTIFGHFAWRFKEEHGTDKLKDFLDNFIHEKQPVFTVSDGMFEKNNITYFPKPFKLTPPQFEQKTKKERIKQFIQQKKSKKLDLITLEQLNFYINGNLTAFDESLQMLDEIDMPGFKLDLRVNVKIDRETFKSQKGQLFSNKPKYLDENTFMNVFIKIIRKNIWDKYECDGILKSVFNLGFGKKKSSGFGEFEVLPFDNFTEFKEPDRSNGFLTLSHYLPANEDNISGAYYDFNVKYGKFGEEKSSSQNPFKPPMILLKPGSCFLTTQSKEYYGRAIKKFSDYHPDAIHNGLAFSVNAKL